MKNINIKKLLGLTLTVLLIVGCKPKVTCSSDDTKNLIIDTYYQSLLGKVTGTNNTSITLETLKTYLEPSITTIETVLSDKDTGAQTCKAQFVLGFKNSESYGVETDRTFTDGIEYQTQMTDDGKTQTIQVTGFGSVGQVNTLLDVGYLTMYQIYSKQNDVNNGQLVKYIGNPSTTANGNWGFDGFKYDGQNIDCNSVANATFQLRDEAQSTKGYKLVDDVCTDAFGDGSNDNPKKCLVTGTVVKTQYGIEFSEITNAELVTMPINCK